MKKLILHSLLFGFCFTLFTGCSKNAAAPKKSVSNTYALKTGDSTTTTTTQTTTGGCGHTCGGGTCGNGGSNSGDY